MHDMEIDKVYSSLLTLLSVCRLNWPSAWKRMVSSPFLKQSVQIADDLIAFKCSRMVQIADDYYMLEDEFRQGRRKRYTEPYGW